MSPVHRPQKTIKHASELSSLYHDEDDSVNRFGKIKSERMTKGTEKENGPCHLSLSSKNKSRAAAKKSRSFNANDMGWNKRGET